MNILTQNFTTGEIQNRIYSIRDKQIMLDSHLAELYDVELKRLNEAVKRNITRFPQEFMFQLTEKEVEFLRSQIATLKTQDNSELISMLSVS